MPGFWRHVLHEFIRSQWINLQKHCKLESQSIIGGWKIGGGWIVFTRPGASLGGLKPCWRLEIFGPAKILGSCVCSSNTKRGKYGGAWQMACKPNWASRRNRNWWTLSVSIARKKARPLAWKLILKDAWRIAVVRLQAWVHVCTCLIKFLQIFCQSCYSVQVCVCGCHVRQISKTGIF